MRSIGKPIYSSQEVFRACISKIRDIDLKDRLELCESTIISASQELESNFSIFKLHTMPVSDNISGHVSGKEMEKVYTDRMAKKNSPGRAYYDKIISSPKNGRCPLCGQRIVSTLDHYLPKTHFPALMVAPLNLVPSCKDCNKIKLDKIPTNATEATLHPYFDEIDGEYWLKCNIIQKQPVSLRFYVDPPSAWDQLLSARVKHHFNVFELASLYGSHAADELSGIRLYLIKIFESGGQQQVSDYLQDAANSRISVFKNSWQSAMYLCLANNNWFCNGGFKVE